MSGVPRYAVCLSLALLTQTLVGGCAQQRDAPDRRLTVRQEADAWHRAEARAQSTGGPRLGVPYELVAADTAEPRVVRPGDVLWVPDRAGPQSSASHPATKGPSSVRIWFEPDRSDSGDRGPATLCAQEVDAENVKRGSGPVLQLGQAPDAASRHRESSTGEPDEPLPPLDAELRLHGSYLYAPEFDQVPAPERDGEHRTRTFRLPECWCAPRPLTAFQEFLGADPIHPRPGLQWFGEDGFQWEPFFAAYGSYELFGSALEQGGHRKDGIGHQLLVDVDMALTATDRFHVQFRPLGRKNSGGSFWQFNDPSHYDDNSTLIPDRYWFEGEINSIFGGPLGDPHIPRDYHVVVGKFPFLLHNALLINDDIVGIAVNKNTIRLSPLSNLNIQAFYGFDDVDSPDLPSPELYGVHLAADYRHMFIELTQANLHESGDADRDAHYAAASVTKFVGPVTLAGRSLFKWSDAAGGDDGQLCVLESNWMRLFSEQLECWTGIEHGVFYGNVFKATSGWTPISGGNFDRLRSTFEVNPLVAIARGRTPEDTVGGSVGVQLFRHHEDESFVPEVAYESPDGTSVWGVGMTYLRKVGPRTYVQARSVRTWSDAQEFEREGVFVSTFVIF